MLLTFSGFWFIEVAKTIKIITENNAQETLEFY